MLADLLSAFLRGLSFVAMTQAAGATLFLAVFDATLGASQRRVERTAWLAATAALVLVPTQFSFAAARMAGRLSGVLDIDLQLFALSTSGAHVLVLRVVGLMLVLAGISKAFRGSLVVRLVGVLLVAASFAFTGHTSSHEERWLLGPLVVFHVLIVSFWFGSLRPLVQVVAGEAPELRAQVVARFSRIAGMLVPIILIAGLVIALRLLPDAGSLRTPYGYILVGKVLAFAALMALAALNKWRWGPALAEDDHRACRSFQSAVKAEWVILVLVLFATAFLTTFWSPT